MKKILAICILAASLPSVAIAGCDKCKEDSVQKKLEHLTEKLELNVEQQGKVQAILEDKKAKKQALKKKYNIDAYRAENMAVGAEHKAALNALLTPEQQKQLQQCEGKKSKKKKKHKLDS